MVMKVYNSFREIKDDLIKLDLQRQIAQEEIKYIHLSVQKELGVYPWLNLVFKAVRKYGVLLLLRKIFRK